ncbi:SGNH/GDSL hydrolase family protein [Burkholderia pseudomallei]|uniref:SGNH/GDSL hydrolase family protein n=2 Tax=Burkholderia pseudomallei TaxID=28450 RepID=UPI000F244538|nr:SGNH/GDSL hydrolase family protein [Burkholderia pseudomallei]CAJ2712588.1 G-D-S-L family lipolytic protein [Burkholderia pseudomallei]CAJ4673385.1 G-D-S-L family lipolytic protein [Burkholderia pseudomallei]VBM95035.1 G-D-S-L family lipolytic protein [Burkholderia pseudomallei]VBX79344.1 G-D-S-L family lipolytic protein [Burkholderia pseudomallei]VBX79369.1 G-D-S-L family lipolytic protein [Burkholderia pseudomallei]
MKQGMIPVIKTKTGKTMIRALLLGATALLLSACGGGGDGGSSPSTQTQQSAQKSVLIEYVGDSTVYGCTLLEGNPRGPQCLENYAQSPHNEPAMVQYLLDKKSIDQVTVLNSGVAGTTVADLLNGTNKVPQPWWPHVQQSKAQIIVMNYGINDAYAPGMTPELFSAELDQVISAAKAAGKQIILETPNPIMSDHASYLASLVDAEKQTAAKWGVQVIDQYGYLSSIPNWPSMLSDGMHPTDAGYELKGQHAYNALSQTVAWYLAH